MYRYKFKINWNKFIINIFILFGICSIIWSLINGNLEGIYIKLFVFEKYLVDED